MKKITHLIWLFLAISCIPLEDVLPPSIQIDEEENMSTEVGFAYQESIKLSVLYRDNSALKQWRVDIQRLEVKSPEADWLFTQTVQINNKPRAANINIVVPIPARFNDEYISTGDYEFTLTLFDLDSNRTVYIDTFNIVGDIKKPDFLSFSTSMRTNLPAGAPDGSQFLACPQQPIKFFGNVADKTKLRRVGFSYTGRSESSVVIETPVFEYDTVSLAQYMNESQQIILPTSLNGQLIDLKLFAEDVFGNRRDTTFKVFVKCDVQAPTINLQEASKMPVNGTAYVVENTDFVIKSMLIADNEALKKAVVKFGERGKALEDYQTFDLSGKTSETITNLVVRKDSLVLGKTYQFYVGVTDTSTVLLPDGNLAALSFEIQVVKDEPPVISAMDFYLNKGTPKEQKFAGAAAGETIVITGIVGQGLANSLIPDGKGEDDVAIARLVMRWTDPSGKITVPVDKNINPAASVIKFTDHAGENTFQFTTAGIYTLEIVMTDTKGQVIPAANRVYRFNVLN